MDSTPSLSQRVDSQNDHSSDCIERDGAADSDGVRAYQVDLQFLAVLLADGDVGERAKSCGNAVNCLAGILHHVAYGLPAALNKLPSLFRKIDLLAPAYNWVKEGKGEGVTVEVNYLCLHLIWVW